MIAAAFVQVRKVRASQGRITSGGGDSKASATEIYRHGESYGKGGKAV